MLDLEDKRLVEDQMVITACFDRTSLEDRSEECAIIARFRQTTITDQTGTGQGKENPAHSAGNPKKYGKNAILKGMNLGKGVTGRERNEQIGGHKA